MDNIYDEFDDCVWNGTYCSSEKARQEMVNIKSAQGLSFTFNPGGGEFYKRMWRCQITTCDDVLDLNMLRDAVKKMEK